MRLGGVCIQQLNYRKTWAISLFELEALHSGANESGTKKEFRDQTCLFKKLGAMCLAQKVVDSKVFHVIFSAWSQLIVVQLELYTLYIATFVCKVWKQTKFLKQYCNCCIQSWEIDFFMFVKAVIVFRRPL